MKKFLALALALVMAFALCACGGGDDAADSSAADDAAAAAAEAAAADAAALEAENEAPAEEEEAGGASGEASGEAGGASGEASGEASGAQAGNALDLSVNEVIPTEAEPETYTADEDGWKQYMLDCAYYAMGTDDSDNKLGATYYDIMQGSMTDMFVNMWGVDDMDSFIAAGGVPAVQPWTLTQGQGTPDTVPDATEAEG